MERLLAIILSVLLGLASVQPLSAGSPLAVTLAGVPEGRSIHLAQLRLDFGVSEATVRRALRRQGYREIDIFYRGMTKARVKACKGGDRYQMEVAPNGRIKSAGKIGACRRRIDLAKAQDILRKRGYREVLLEQTPRGGYRGAACRGPERMEMAVDPFGEVRELKRLGQCRHLLSRPEVAARLRSQGYDRIAFSDSPPPPFVAKACRGLERVRLVVVGSGRIFREQRIGRCEPPIDPGRIAEVVARQGFTRVQVTDDVLPRYAAVACRDGVRVEVTLNRFGEIRGQRKIGRCASRLTRERLAEKLRAEGFQRLRFVEGGPDGFLVEACRGVRRLRIRFSAYGETDFERDLGPCKSPRIGRLIDDFQGRGLSGVTLYLEGCREGRRMRVELDRFGKAVNARRIGRCP